jgi:hypothetical protein
LGPIRYHLSVGSYPHLLKALEKKKAIEAAELKKKETADTEKKARQV